MDTGMTDDKSQLHAEVLTQISALMTAAFGLVAALAWNDAIQSTFRQLFGTYNAVPIKMAYAIIVTIIAVIMTRWIAKMNGKDSHG